jgi:hypothetical protein
MVYAPQALDLEHLERSLREWEAGFPRPVVDLSRLREVDALGILLLALEGRRCVEVDGFLRLLVPENPNLASMLTATALRDLVEGRIWSDRLLPPRATAPLIRIVRVREEGGVTELVDGLSEALLARFPFGEDSVRLLSGAMLEVFQNIPQHAATASVSVDPYGLGAVRETENYVEVAAVDKGVGLRGSLASNPRFRDLTALQAIEAALVRGSSRFDRRGRGGTLKRIREVVSRNEGRFYVRSGGAAFLQTEVEWETAEVFPFPGVQLSIRLPRRRFE